MVVESKIATECIIFNEKVWCVIELNRHYFGIGIPKLIWNKMSDFIKQIWSPHFTLLVLAILIIKMTEFSDCEGSAFSLHRDFKFYFYSSSKWSWFPPINPDRQWLKRETGSFLHDTGDRRKQMKLRAGGARWDGTVWTTNAVTVLKRSGVMVEPLKVMVTEEPKPRCRAALLRDNRSDRVLLTRTESRRVHLLTGGTGENDSEMDRNMTGLVKCIITCHVMKQWDLKCS